MVGVTNEPGEYRSEDSRRERDGEQTEVKTKEGRERGSKRISEFRRT